MKVIEEEDKFKDMRVVLEEVRENFVFMTREVLLQTNSIMNYFFENLIGPLLKSICQKDSLKQVKTDVEDKIRCENKYKQQIAIGIPKYMVFVNAYVDQIEKYSLHESYVHLLYDIILSDSHFAAFSDEWMTQLRKKITASLLLGHFRSKERQHLKDIFDLWKFIYPKNPLNKVKKNFKVKKITYSMKRTIRFHLDNDETSYPQPSRPFSSESLEQEPSEDDETNPQIIEQTLIHSPKVKSISSTKQRLKSSQSSGNQSSIICTNGKEYIPDNKIQSHIPFDQTLANLSTSSQEYWLLNSDNILRMSPKRMQLSSIVQNDSISGRSIHLNQEQQLLLSDPLKCKSKQIQSHLNSQHIGPDSWILHSNLKGQSAQEQYLGSVPQNQEQWLICSDFVQNTSPSSLSQTKEQWFLNSENIIGKSHVMDQFIIKSPNIINQSPKNSYLVQYCPVNKCKRKSPSILPLLQFDQIQMRSPLQSQESHQLDKMQVNPSQNIFSSHKVDNETLPPICLCCTACVKYHESQIEENVRNQLVSNKNKQFQQAQISNDFFQNSDSLYQNHNSEGLNYLNLECQQGYVDSIIHLSQNEIDVMNDLEQRSVHSSKPNHEHDDIKQQIMKTQQNIFSMERACREVCSMHDVQGEQLENEREQFFVTEGQEQETRVWDCVSQDKYCYSRQDVSCENEFNLMEYEADIIHSGMEYKQHHYSQNEFAKLSVHDLAGDTEQHSKASDSFSNYERHQKPQIHAIIKEDKNENNKNLSLHNNEGIICDNDEFNKDNMSHSQEESDSDSQQTETF